MEKKTEERARFPTSPTDAQLSRIPIEHFFKREDYRFSVAAQARIGGAYQTLMF